MSLFFHVFCYGYVVGLQIEREKIFLYFLLCLAESIIIVSKCILKNFSKMMIMQKKKKRVIKTLKGELSFTKEVEFAEFDRDKDFSK